MQPTLRYMTLPPWLVLAAAASSLAGETPGTLAGGQSATPVAVWLFGLLAAALLGIAGSLVVGARRRATAAVAAERQLYQQVSELKKAGETLSRMAAIIESSDDAIIGKTLDGIVTSWNPAAERMYGYSAAEVIGRSVSLLIPPERPDELQHILEKIRHGERVDHVETLRMRKDGRLIHVSLSVSPIMDATGEIVGASTIARDITERK